LGAVSEFTRLDLETGCLKAMQDRLGDLAIRDYETRASGALLAQQFRRFSARNRTSGPYSP